MLNMLLQVSNGIPQTLTTYYTGVDQDHNDPDFSLQAQEDSFDNDSDPAFTAKHSSIMKSTMRDILKEFQGSSLQKTDLNQTAENLSEKLPRKSKSKQNQLHLQVIVIPG